MLVSRIAFDTLEIVFVTYLANVQMLVCENLTAKILQNFYCMKDFLVSVSSIKVNK